jgi:2-polyprenyl-3-methyl-5-hydroxy-6-metoxy-1,4-benzoquinol methylase
MSGASVRCPDCGGATVALGAIPSSNFFSGQRLARPIPGGRLLRCATCDLSFRHPRLSKGELDVLYKATSIDNWQYTPASRKDWEIARRTIHERLPCGRVLDIGCFDGKFLAYVGEPFEPYGVEINAAAADAARARNVTIVGDDLEDIGNLSRKFHAIVAIDVLEHVRSPRRLLAKAAGILLDGGLLMISTGNTKSWTWKMMGSRYWYCTIPEHISFLNVPWAERAAAATALDIVDVHYFAHDGDATYLRRGIDLGKNLAYLVAPAMVERLRDRRFRRETEQSSIAIPPMWLSAPDHFMVVFRKRSNGA